MLYEKIKTTANQKLKGFTPFKDKVYYYYK
jgi:hypothetical protein